MKDEKAPRRAPELPEHLQALAPYERPSGAPFRPATTPQAIPAGTRVIMCPLSAVVPGTRQCPFVGRITREVVYDHLTEVHGWSERIAGDYLADPWFGDESRQAWKDRTFYRRYGRDMVTAPGPGEPVRPATPEEIKRYLGEMGQALGRRVAEVRDSAAFTVDKPRCPKTGCLDTLPHLHSRAETAEDKVIRLPFLRPEGEEFCDHPNGFGPMGCPCGATRDGEDDPLTVRNLATGEDVPAARCPACSDAFPDARLRKHLEDDHGWAPDNVEDWAEKVDLDATALQQAIDERKQNRSELDEHLDLFFDPNVPTEALVSNPEEMAKALTPNALEALLTEWWMDKADEEVRRTVPKAVEYGSTDLAQIGHDLAAMAGRKVSDAEAAELGIMFYARGKMSRWIDAVIRGDRVSDDTLFDLGVYVRMAQRVRDAGGWPGLPKD
jgi:hypothetical protein